MPQVQKTEMTKKDLAARMAPNDENVLLMRRMQHSNFWLVWRVTNLLLKIKRQAREEEAW